MPAGIEKGNETFSFQRILLYEIRALTSIFRFSETVIEKPWSFR